MAKRHSRRGGASAPQACKTSLRSCLRGGPALDRSTSRSCFKTFNNCRSKRKGKGRGKKR
jgi:hypothetical protein